MGGRKAWSLPPARKRWTAVPSLFFALSVAGCLAGALAPAGLHAHEIVPERRAPKNVLGSLPLYFIENRGQSDPRVAFYVQGRDTDMYFTRRGLTFALKSPAAVSRPDAPLERWAVQLEFLGARPEAEPQGQTRHSAVVSYFKGSPDEWRTAIPTYGAVAYRELWPGIDLVYDGGEGNLKYSFLVEPGADPGAIQLAYRGASSVRVTNEGRLAIETPLLVFEDDRPYAYQEIGGERIEVAARYVLADADESGAYRYTFELGPYDETKPLVIDPVFLSYAGYIGGSSSESANNVAVDGSGNAYVTGWTTSTDFPTQTGPETTHSGGTYDAFVTKVSADGTALVYSGYIGGSSSDFGNRIAVDGSGNAYVSGQTNSSDFPLAGSGDLGTSSYGGSTDAFVAKVNATGTGLDYSGYIGGSSTDLGNGIAVDGSGNAYVTGTTSSTEGTFPVTGGPDTTLNGGSDAFVAKIDGSGNLAYAGYIGGTDNDEGFDVAVDGSDRAHVTGFTLSDETTESFPVSVGPGLTYSGSDDIFVARLNGAGTALEYCGYIGGTGVDRGHGIAVDGSGNAYVAGRTGSSETAGFPVLIGPDLFYNGGTNDGYVCKVGATGASLVFCGYVGGSGNEGNVNDVAIDADGNVYISGYTGSTETSFPVTRGPDQTHNGGWDAFVAKIDASGASLVFAGYIGGSANDFGNGVAVDSSGAVYVVGQTSSDESTFPANIGPDTTFNGTSDGWVAKIEDTGGTAVDLFSFRATGSEGAVRVEWETASELDNLGFHLHRAPSEEGPYERITASLIPGLGSSPEGAAYGYLDTDVVEDAVYYYKLEDVETGGRSEMHGPVSAAPLAGSPTVPDSEPPSPVRLRLGRPESASLRVLERSATGMELELRTGGFLAMPLPDGRVRLAVPGFLADPESSASGLPSYRSWLEVPPGREVRLERVREEEVQVFARLVPAAVSRPEIAATRGGVLRLRAASARSGARPRSAPPARILESGYQRGVRKALLELSPLRWDPARGGLVLTRRLVVRISFSGREMGAERERRGKSSKEKQSSVLAHLGVAEKGLYRLRFEEVAKGKGRALDASSLRLSRLGEPVPFHIEPDRSLFGPGSVLYFWTEGADLNPYDREAVYRLEKGEGEPMLVRPADPSGPPVETARRTIFREENRYYQAGLLEAPDLWLWDVLFAPVKKTYPFSLPAPALDAQESEPALLVVALQGASASAPPDHHLRVFVNDHLVAATQLDGKTAAVLRAEVPLGLLREGANDLAIENVGDTGAQYSMVLLDRFEIAYPHRPSAGGTLWEGSFETPGHVEVSGAGEDPLVLDVTDRPVWLEGRGASFAVEAGRTYAVVPRASVLLPRVEKPRGSRLAGDRRGADYLIVGPEGLLAEAAPLAQLRRRQGLRSRTVALEDVYEEFGSGERRPEALREFLSHAYHHWPRPAPRYVLLLGDGTYDFKDYLKAGARNHVPPWMVKTSFLWTASDAAYAAVHGEDPLPDLAVGRLPISSPEETRIAVRKILAYESSGSVTEGPVVLVADDPDQAGNFVENAEELAEALLSARDPRKIYLDRLDTEAARSAIVESFDRGASLLSYIGHGGIHVWAQENVFDLARAGTLAPQSQQPVVLTLNCLNGYFHFPYFDSLAEALVGAEDRGAIAAVSPSGLGLNTPAHLYHRALLGELLSAAHERLGDALLAAQAAYADTGAFPELLAIYHLFGDPALRIR